MSPASNRLPGYDVARCVAIYGVVVIDMIIHVAMDFRGVGMIEDGPKPLMWMYQMWWGRASVMLAVLAGTGLALMFKPTDTAEDRVRKRKIILRRTLFLLIVGHLWNSSTLWSFSILHAYAFFLLFGMMFATARPMILLSAALATIAISVPIQQAFHVPDREFDSPPDPGGPPAGDSDALLGTPQIWDARFWDPWVQFQDIFLDSQYPVFPWLGFVLFGMWVVRIGIGQPKIRSRILAGATLILGASFLIWWLFSPQSNPNLQLLVDIERIPPRPLYVFSAAAQAVILLCLCLMAADRPSASRWSAPLVATGQMTFTIYIAHILIGGGDRQGLFDVIGLPTGLVGGWIRVAIFFGFTLVACHYWKKRIGRGPLEAAMRWFSDR